MHSVCFFKFKTRSLSKHLHENWSLIGALVRQISFNHEYLTGLLSLL